MNVKELCKKIKIPAFAVLAASAGILIVGGTGVAEISNVVEITAGIVALVSTLISAIVSEK